MGSKTKVKTKTRKKRAEENSKKSKKRSKKELKKKDEKSRKRKIDSKKSSKTNSKKSKLSSKPTDYRNILGSSGDKDWRSEEKKLRERILKKRKEEADEEELLKTSSSSSSSSTTVSGSSGAKSSTSTTSAKSSVAKSSVKSEHKVEDNDVQEALDASRRASIIASSNIHPSDGDDEDNNSSKKSEKSSKSNSSMASNRSRLSSGSKASSLTAARNTAAKKTPNDDSKKFAEYDQIERQLLADQEKELEYLNGLDQPINKADLPLLCPDEDSNGPPMNEPMKLRISRLKRTKIWVRNIPPVAPLIRDEVDEYIEAQKRLKEIEENDFEAIFDTPTDSGKLSTNEKTLEMESNLKLAILGRLKKQA